MKTTIAVMGLKTDKQSLAFAECVTARGGEPRILEMRLGRGGCEQSTIGPHTLSWNGEDCTDIASYYLRATAPNTWPSLPPVLNQVTLSEFRTLYLREQEFQAFSYSFFSVLSARGKLVVNRPEKYVDHNSKAQFYERLRSAGYHVPETLTTNDPERFAGYVKKHGKVVVKPGIGVGSTRLLREDQLERTHEIALGPVMMQQFVPGYTMRIHVVGETVVLALKILSDQIDSRTAPEGFEYATLPPEAEKEVVGATKHLGLHFAAWDIILTEDGHAMLLDCNPGPFLMWIGEAFVQAVYLQLAGFLLSFAREGSMDKARAQVEPCPAP